jgi:hypothetical protein
MSQRSRVTTTVLRCMGIVWFPGKKNGLVCKVFGAKAVALTKLDLETTRPSAASATRKRNVGVKPKGQILLAPSPR